tara:strand:- start:476 stop:1951 length:1476 start_codon:yes stop_codon:yes gene_type:complete
MTNRRGRPERTGTQKPKQDTFNFVMENPEIKPSKVEEKLLLIRQQIMVENDGKNIPIDDIYYVPSIQHIARNWVPEARRALLSEEVKELLKPYNPIVTHNSPFWKGSNHLYSFTPDDKLMLLNIYNQLRELWFLPLGIKENEITVNQAMWICIVANTVEELKTYPIDLFLMSNFLATKYLVGLQAGTFTVAQAPTETVEKHDMDYIMNMPYQSKNHYAYWSSLQASGHVPEPESEWFYILRQVYNKYDDKWFTDFPLNWASQLDSFQWLPPFHRVRFILATFLQSYLVLLDSKFYSFRNHKWADKNLIYLQAIRDNIMNNITRDDMSVTPVVFNDKNDQLRNITLKFNANHYDRYMKLLLSISRLCETKPEGSMVGVAPMPNLDHIDKTLEGNLGNPIAEYYAHLSIEEYSVYFKKTEVERREWGIDDKVHPMTRPEVYNQMMTEDLEIEIKDTFFKVEDSSTYIKDYLNELKSKPHVDDNKDKLPFIKYP